MRAHVEHLTGQLARIIADGAAQDKFELADAASAGRAVFNATARFDNPVHAAEWLDPSLGDAYDGVRSLVVAGLDRRSPLPSR